MGGLRKFLNLAFEEKNSKTYHLVNDFLAVIIVLSVLAIVTESVEDIYFKYKTIFLWSEVIVMVIFTAEYIIYIYLAPKKLKYILSPLGLIDLLAILPTYLGVVFGPLAILHPLRVLRVVRVLRLMRILRFLKLLAYADRQKPEAKKYMKHIPWRNIEIYFFTLFSVVIIAGTLMYLAENGLEGTQFSTIPHSLWWAIVTLTTVGYGDMIPETLLGRLIASLTMVFGVMLFAVLVSVLGSAVHKILFGIVPKEEDNLQLK